MIRKFMILFVVLLAAAGLGTLAEEGALTLDQVLAKNLEARGGREALDAVTSMKITGKMSGGPMEIPMTMLRVRPDKFRVDFTFQGMTGSQVFTGEGGWKLMPFGGKTDPEPLSQDEIKQAAEQADFDGPLIDWKKKGFQLELVGLEDLDGSQVYKLKLTRKNGDVEYHYLDAEYFLTVKTSAKKTIQGNEMEFESTFGDFKQVGDLVLPHLMEAGAKGMPGKQKMVFESYELNPEIPEDVFKMPEVKAEPEAAGGGF